MRITNEYIEETDRMLAAHGVVFTGMPDVITDIIRMSRRRDHGFVLGESGSGKELAVNGVELLKQRTNRISGTLFTYNCATFSKELAAGAFFGYERGAYTGAKATGSAGIFHKAHNNRLFLDEIGDLLEAVQAQLLRVLESGEFSRVGSDKTEKVNVQVFAATSIDAAVNRIRPDLYNRISANMITLPSFDERPIEAKEPLIRTLLERALRNNIEITRNMSEPEMSHVMLNVDPEVITLIAEQKFPGNVREVDNLAGAIVAEATDEFYDTWKLPNVIPVQLEMVESVLQRWAKRPRQGQEHAVQASANEFLDGHGKPLTLEGVEKRALEASLERNDGNRRRVSEELGIGERTVYRKMKDFGLTE